MAHADKFNYTLIENTALPYTAAGNPLTMVESYVAGQNILTSTKNFTERRPGFEAFESTATVFPNNIRRLFTWRRWNGSFFIMLCEVSGSQSIVHKLEIGTDANFVSLFTSTSTEPFDFVVSKNQVFFGNGTDMRKYDGATLSIWGITAPAAAPVVAVVVNSGDTGLDSPTSTAGSHADWVTPNNVFTSNDAYAIDITFNNNDLISKTFAVSVTNGATVVGIEVLIEGNADDATPANRDIDVSLTKDGSTPVGTPKTDQTLNQGSDTTITLGSSSDLWGTTWTEAEVESANFGIIIARSSAAAAGEVAIDHVQVRVHFITGFSATSGYRYAKAYGNSSTGHISSRSVVSDSTGSFTTRGVDVTLVASGDAQVDEIHVYRSTDGGGGTYFEITNSPFTNSNQTINDVTADENLSSNTAPGPTSNDPPPAAKGFVYFANRIWMFVDNRVWYSGWEEIINGVEEESVPSGEDGNFWEFDNEVTGLGVTSEMVLVFTANRLYKIEGDERDLFQRTILFERIGCRERATITSMGRVVGWLDTADNINVTDGFSLDVISRKRDADGDTIWTIEPDLTGIDHTQASMTFHNDGDRKWLLLLDGEDSILRVYDFDNEIWMVPWTVGGGAIHSGETSLGAFDLLLGHTSKKCLKVGTAYQDDGTNFAADLTSSLFRVVTTPGKRGVLEYLSVESGTRLPQTISALTDDDPVLSASSFAISSSNEKDPGRTQGLNLREQWAYFSRPPARRVSVKLEWPSENQNFQLYSLSFATLQDFGKKGRT